MKVCIDCGRVVSDKEEQCSECGSIDFQALLVPFYDDLEPYIEEEDG